MSPPEVSAHSFEELLDAARTGSKEALGKLLEAFRKVLLFRSRLYLNAQLRPKASDSDLVQETFLEADRDFPSFRGSSQEEFLRWLSQILRHNASNFRRRCFTAKRQITREVSLEDSSDERMLRRILPAPEPPPEINTIHQEEKRIYTRAFQGLQTSYKEIIHLRFVEQLSFPEISERLHCSPDAARKLCQRAVQKLADAADALSHHRT
jgi:RNA polymerase sigma-70 factor (ECF subfamily)